MNVKRQIFEFIVDHQVRWNTLPTQAEIYDVFSGMSDDVDLHLRQLNQEGLIAIGTSMDIPVALTPIFHSPTRINFRGTTSANGSMMLTLRGIDVPLPSHDLEAMQIFDESMVDAGIEHGDMVLLACAAPARGDIVAVSLSGVDTLRRYLMFSGIPHLLAENPRRPELHPAFDVPVHGVMCGLIRMGSCRHRPNLVQKSFSYSEIAAEKPNGEVELRFDVQSIATSRSDTPPIHKKRRHETKKKDRRNVPSSGEVPSPPNWPEPPSGIMLNDSRTIDYRSNENPLDQPPEMLPAAKRGNEE